MVDEFPSNSHTGKEAKTTPQAQTQSRTAKDPKKVERITTGEVMQRKKPLTKRAKELFFGGDARGAFGFVAMSVLIPAAKDMVADAGREVIERLVFGESTGPRRGGYRGATGPVGHTRYDGQFRPGGYSPPGWQRPQDPRREVSQRARSLHAFDEIILESRGEAEQVIETLFEMVSQYQQATVADLYELVGITSAYTDNKYGWTDMRGSGVQHVRGGAYLLNLPKPIALD